MYACYATTMSGGYRGYKLVRHIDLALEGASSASACWTAVAADQQPFCAAFRYTLHTVIHAPVAVTGTILLFVHLLLQALGLLHPLPFFSLAPLLQSVGAFC